ncbi:hypothetical protein Bbelb_061530 [Branchiostoma belcheri]|nr:hypothetical protein Bbelb_061530 [Branchiostoma belcheri]
MGCRKAELRFQTQDMQGLASTNVWKTIPNCQTPKHTLPASAIKQPPPISKKIKQLPSQTKTHLPSVPTENCIPKMGRQPSNFLQHITKFLQKRIPHCSAASLSPHQDTCRSQFLFQMTTQLRPAKPEHRDD